MRSIVVSAVLALATVRLAAAGGEAPAGGVPRLPPSRWLALAERAREVPHLRSLLLGMSAEATATLRCDPRSYRRATSIEEILPEMRDSSIGRAGRNGLAYALAMSDCAQADFLRRKGVQLALLAVYLQREDLESKCVEMLREAARWRPLQRPGWTLYEDSRQLPPGGDGVFLATSWGLLGIVDMLSILGERVPPDLRVTLNALIREEVLTIVDDWSARRPWYVASNAVSSNQWAEPSAALVRACLFLGDPKLQGAYELGVANLAATLRASGDDGAFLEGVGYAQMTMGTVCDAVSEMHRAGDDRLASMPFMRGFWKWLIHMHMPGRRLVNCFDSKLSELPDWAIRTPLSSLVSAAIASGEPSSLRTLRALFPEGSPSLSGLEYAAAIIDLPAEGSVGLDRFAHFPSEQLVTWRTEFESPSAPQTAFALWVRGGSLVERSHAHRDQGHLSVYLGDRIVLMECGSPDYADPDYDRVYAEAAGHSVMQIGEVRPRGTPVDAPLRVRRLDASGGCVEVDSARAYIGADRCSRTIAWDRGGTVTIDDDARLRAEAPAGTEWYRFHLGTVQPPTISGSDGRWSVAWDGVLMNVSSPSPIVVDQVDWPDRTWSARRHRAVRVRSAAAQTGLELRTELRLPLPVRP